MAWFAAFHLHQEDKEKVSNLLLKKRYLGKSYVPTVRGLFHTLILKVFIEAIDSPLIFFFAV